MTSSPPEAANGGRTDQRYRQQLRDILARDEAPSSDRIQEILQLGADRYGVELGLLVQIDQAGQTYTIDEVSTPHPDITRGLTGDLLSTYCRMVVNEQEPLAIDNAPEQGWSNDPAYQSSLLSTYIGTAVTTGDTVYGTVCFVDLAPREGSFDDAARSFLEHLGEAIEQVLEQEESAGAEQTGDADHELSVVERRYRTALQHSPVTFAKVDEELRYEWICNPHSDFRLSDVIGKRDDELDSGAGIDQLIDLKRRTIEQGEQIREEIVFERSDGLNVYDVTATPLREGQGDAVTGLITASLNVTERREKERKLEESEARYRTLVENFPEGAVGVYDRDLRYKLVRGTLVGDVLPPAEEFDGSRVPDVFPEKTTSDIVPLFRTAVEEGELGCVETQFGGRDWKVWATPLRDRNGEIFAGLSFAQDITERSGRERTLRRQRNLLDQAQRLAGAWEVDLRTENVSWSETLYEIHEVPPGAEIDLDDALDYFPAEARTQLRAAFQRCVDEEEPYDLELPLTTANGNERWVRTVGAPAKVEDGRVVKVAGAFQDITERKEEERKREQVIRRVTDAIVEVNADWQFTLVNDQAEALYDRTEDELLGKNFWDVFSEAIGTRFENTYRGVMQSREPASLVEYYPGLNGWFDITAYPNDDGGVAFYFQEITERKKREARLRDLANSIPGVVFQFYARPDGTFGNYFVSEHAEDILGIPPDPDTFHERCLEHIPNSHREAFQASVEAAVEAEAPWEFEAPFDKPSGERRWILGRSIPRRQDGEVVFNGVLLDITDRKEAEQAHHRLAEAMEVASDGMALLDEEGTYTYMNQAHAEIFGYDSPEAFLGNTWRMCYADEQAERFEEEFMPVLHENGTWTGEVEGKRKDGTPVPQQVTLTQLEDGGLICVTRDITERKEAERELRRSERRFRKVFKNAAIGIVIGDEDGRLLRANPAFQSMVGYEEAELHDINFSDLTHPDDVATDHDLFEELTSGKRSRYQVEKRYVRKDGETFWGRTTASQLDLGAEKKHVRLVENIGDQKRYEAKLREAKNKAEEAARLKAVMLANMSHEVRTPLTSMIGFSGLLRDQLDGKAAKLARLVHKSGQRLEETMEAVLELSQLEAGSYDTDRQTIHLAPLVRRLADEFELQAKEDEITLDVETGEPPVEAYADETAVRRIVSNLLDNALKFTPDGGQVTLRARTEDAETAVVEVEDTGVGIGEEALSKVFEAFKQESEGLTREYEGAGLGLSIVRELVETLRGQIEVDSEKGVGTCMTVHLPKTSGGGTPGA